jgi:hypothetical protein
MQASYAHTVLGRTYDILLLFTCSAPLMFFKRYETNKSYYYYYYYYYISNKFRYHGTCLQGTFAP